MTSLHGHLEEGDLLRLIDGEADEAERRQWAHHLNGCVACAGSLRQLERSVARVSQGLAGIPIPDSFLDRDLPRVTPAQVRRLGVWPRGGLAGPRILRAAAVTLLVLMPIVAVGPLRAWVSGLITGADDPESETVAAAAAPAIPSEASSEGALAFTPSTDTLRVELAAWQTSGSLLIEKWGGSDVQLIIRESEAGEHPLLSERLLRVENSAGSTASYDLRLPRAVRAVSVAAAGDVLRVIDLQSTDGPWSIPLNRP